ncbi:hypothetical protein FRC01_013101 [Tulasnella sp. 417]|nr:hypothetical protein FRC01_013101 [Tulasnella sp. 417]
MSAKEAKEKPTNDQKVPWTLLQKDLVPPASGNRIDSAAPKDQVAEMRFYGTLDPADIIQESLVRLEEGRWLNDNQCTFYCYEVGNAYLEGSARRSSSLVVLHARTWRYSAWDGGYPKHIREKGLQPALACDYLAFPANDSENHFFLCIIVHPCDLLLDNNPDGPVRTVAIILNSLSGLKPTQPQTKIRKIISHLAQGLQLRQNELSNLKVYQPLVAQQTNFYDCGLYPGHFLSVFLSAPEAFTLHCTGETPLEGPVDLIWKHHFIRSARERLRKLVTASAIIRQSTIDALSIR